VLFTETGEKQSVGDTQCYVMKQERNRGKMLRNERKISPTLKISTMNTAPLATSRRAIIAYFL